MATDVHSNANALTHLLLTERSRVLRFAQRILGSAAMAEDVAQSLWLRIQRVGDDPPIENKRAYLYRLTANLAIDHAKADARRAKLHANAAHLQGDTEPAICGESVQLARDELNRIAAIVQALPPRARQVFMLNRIDGLSQREIAVRIGVSKPTVEKDLARAFDAIMNALERKD